MNKKMSGNRAYKNLRRYNVEFDEASFTVYEIPNLETISSDEKADIWFTFDDLRRMKESDLTIIRKLRVGCAMPDEARGLEKRSPIAQMEKRIAMMDGIAAVLGEQSRQKNDGTIDEQIIRNRYKKATSMLINEAFERGAKDAEEAQLNWFDGTSWTARNVAQFPVNSNSTSLDISNDVFVRTKSSKHLNARKMFQQFLQWSPGANGRNP